MAKSVEPETLLQEFSDLESHCRCLNSRIVQLPVEVPNEIYKVYWQQNRNILYFTAQLFKTSAVDFF